MPPDELTSSVEAGTDSSADSTALAPLDAAPSGGENLQPADQPAGTEAPAWESVIASIPDDDTDLQQPTFPHVKGLQEQRAQLRVLKGTIKEWEPERQSLAAYKALGEVAAIKPAVELANLLYSTLIDPRTGQPVIDPATGTTHVTTKPFVQYLDENSPGMPEQLLVDLLDFEPTDEAGNKTEKLSRQVFRHWGLDPSRINQYRNIDTLVASSNGAVTAAELTNIDPIYHDAYRNLPPSVRNAWDAYDEADQLVLLRREKESLDRVVKDRERDERDKEREAQENAAYRARLTREQIGYIGKVRSERFASIAEQLAKQVTFSPDATTNSVMHGALGTVLANLIDPDMRFVSTGLLTALGVKLDPSFDTALNTFNTAACETVAFSMQGDMVRSANAEQRANTAANLLSTKLATIALKVAKAMGGQQAAAAAATGAALDTAATSRPVAGIGSQGNGQLSGVLPAHIRPGTPEAARYLAESTGFWRNS